MTPLPKRRRRRFQFRLRTLMIVVTLLAIVCAYVGSEASKVRKRQRLREIVIKAGGTVTMSRPAKIGANPAPVSTPGWLRSLLGDESAGFIMIPNDGVSADEEQAIRSAFPEAAVLKN